MVEFHTHGSKAVVNKIQNSFRIWNDCRLANLVNLLKLSISK